MRSRAGFGVPAIVLVVTLLATGCGGGPKTDTPSAQFLLLAHQSLAGSLASQPDARLLSLGHRACAEMDARKSSDVIVADLGGDPLPGSADFNAYSFVVVAAAMQLCPNHRSEFSSVPGM